MTRSCAPQYVPFYSKSEETPDQAWEPSPVATTGTKTSLMSRESGGGGGPA